MAAAALPANPALQSVPQVKSNQNGFVATFNDETMRVVVCSDSVIHVAAAPGVRAVQGASPAQPWMLGDSIACPGAKFDFQQDADGVSLVTARLRVKLENKGGNLVYSTNNGGELLRESPAVPRTYAPMELNGIKALTVEDRFMPEMTEELYGLGQHQNGMFNYRGATVELGQDNTDVAVPLLISTKGYRLLWNTASLTYFDNRYPKVFSFSSADANAIDYYFIYGPEMDDIIHGYCEMTGHASLFPMQAYGFFQSKNAYESQDEVLEVARRYRSEHIPLDCIVQDGGWWNAMGNLAFRSTYTDIPAMLKRLRDEHIHTMISAWGLYKDGSTNLETLKANAWLVPGTYE